jgi:Uma2 family endonuclease
MTTSVITGYSLDDFLRLPDVKPALEYGPDGVSQKVAPKTVHSVVQKRVLLLLDQRGRGGLAFAELRITVAGRSYVPDVAFFVADSLPRQPDGAWIEDVTSMPDLVIEIISPGQGRRELEAKCQWYVAHGARHLNRRTHAWLVDPQRRSVRQWPTVEDAHGRLSSLLHLPQGGVVQAAELFSDLP